MRKLNSAWEVLSDSERRAEYDRSPGDRPQSSAASSSYSDAGTAAAPNVEDIPTEGDRRASVRPWGSVLAATGVLLVLLLAGFTIGSRVVSPGSAKPNPSSAALGALTTTHASQTEVGLATPAPGQITGTPSNAGQHIGTSSVWLPNMTGITSVCGRDASRLNPNQNQDCIVQAMEADSASAEAVTFFRATGNFLVDFTEEGNVDMGVIEAPWQNMNRPQTVLLNGSFGVMGLERLVPGDWQRDPRYLTLSNQASGALLLWPEYATASVAPGSQGGQVVIASMRLSSCRVCDTPANLVVQATFDSAGSLQSSALLDPRPP